MQPDWYAKFGADYDIRELKSSDIDIWASIDKSFCNDPSSGALEQYSLLDILI